MIDAYINSFLAWAMAHMEWLKKFPGYHMTDDEGAERYDHFD